MRITSTGNVGIGTSTPWEKFVIASDGDADFDLSVASDSESPAIHIRRARGSHSSPSFTTSGDTIYNLEGETWNGTSYSDVGRISMSSAADSGSGSTPGFMAFHTTPVGSIVVSERMRITSDGSIGIGTTSPSAKLAITATAGTGDIFAIASSTNARLFTVTSAGNVGIGTTSPQANLFIQGASGQTDNLFTIASSSGANLVTVSNAGIATFASDVIANGSFKSGNICGLTCGAHSSIQLSTYLGFTIGANEKMRIDISGNVGIATTTPSQLLTVGSTTNSQFLVNATGTILDGTWQGDVIASAYLDTATILASEISNSSQLAGLLSDEVGTGPAVFASSTVLTSPTLFGGTVSNNFSFSGTSANIALGSNFLSGDGDDEGIYVASDGRMGIGTTTLDSTAMVTMDGTATPWFSFKAIGTEFGRIGTDDVSLFRVFAASGKDFSLGASSTPEQFIIKTSGNVGIGTTTPSAKLAITGTAGTEDIFAVASSTNARLFTVTSAGNVGIGIANPGAPLQVHSLAGADPKFRLSDADIILPDYQYSSSLGDVSLSSTTGQLKVGGNASGSNKGGIALFGYTSNVNDGYPVAIVGTHGGTSPTTTAAVGIWGQKNNGGGNRGALTASEPILDVGTIAWSTPIFRIMGDGKVGIGTTSPQARLTLTQLADSSTGGFWLSTSDNTDFRSQYMNTSGVLSFYGGDTGGTLNTATLNAAGEWTNASDIAYKENIQDVVYGLDAVLALQPRSYNIKNTNDQRIGFIAQEVEDIIPEVVSGEDGSKGISYGNLVTAAIKAIQELAAKVSGFASLITSERIETETLCVGSTCITEAELEELIQSKREGQESDNNNSSSDDDPDREIETVESDNGTTTENTIIEDNSETDESDTSILENDDEEVEAPGENNTEVELVDEEADTTLEN